MPDDDNEQETSEMQFEDFALKANVLAFASRKQNHKDALLAADLRKLHPSEKESGPMLSQKIIRPSIIQCRSNWALFFVMAIYLEKMMEQFEFWRLKRLSSEPFLSNLGLMKSGRAQWQKAEETRKKSILYWSIRTRNSLFPSSSRSFRTQSHWSFITGQCINSERFLWVHLSHRMCDQFTFHHEFRIDTGRTKFEQQTDGIIHACGSYEQRTQGSWYSRPASTASCTVPADSVEETSKHCVLGRYQTCLKERI